MGPLPSWSRRGLVGALVLLISLPGLAVSLAGGPSDGPPPPGASAAACEFGANLTVDPGLSLTPGSGTLKTTSGFITCTGPVNGVEVEGTGPFNFEGTYGRAGADTCLAGGGDGTVEFHLPIPDGEWATFISRSLSVTRAAGVWTLASGDLGSGTVFTGVAEVASDDAGCGGAAPQTTFVLAGHGTLSSAPDQGVVEEAVEDGTTGMTRAALPAGLLPGTASPAASARYSPEALKACGGQPREHQAYLRPFIIWRRVDSYPTPRGTTAHVPNFHAITTPHFLAPARCVTWVDYVEARYWYFEDYKGTDRWIERLGIEIGGTRQTWYKAKELADGEGWFRDGDVQEWVTP